MEKCHRDHSAASTPCWSHWCQVDEMPVIIWFNSSEATVYSCLVLLGNCLVVWFKLLLQTWKFHHVSYKQVCPKDTHVSIHSLESNIMIEHNPSWRIAQGTIQSIYVSLRPRFDTGNDPRKKTQIYLFKVSSRKVSMLQNSRCPPEFSKGLQLEPLNHQKNKQTWGLKFDTLGGSRHRFIFCCGAFFCTLELLGF